MATKSGGTPRPIRPCTPFPIVGIGASAGGLEAFTQLLQHFPDDAGMGLVLIQHLDPAHESELARLLARVTPMPVHEVTNNLKVEPNHIYVIPPGANMTIVKGVLKLEPRPKSRTPARSIDFFFESLAQDQRERAIGIVLSGTGADGTVGLEAIKAEGGITFAQDESAKYDSMPRSAVAAGCVDFVLAPKGVAKELTRIAKHPYVIGQSSESVTHGHLADTSHNAGERVRESVIARQDDATALPSVGGAVGARQARAEEALSQPGPEDDGFKKILLVLRNHCGVDFSLYKSTTIQRRIARRMVLGKHDTFGNYAKFLRGNSNELDTLFSDVLISVTSFFRNPEAFDVLKRVVFPKLLKQHRDDAVRVWVLGCSTGQEAYSVGMAFSECAESVPRTPKLQIFATDLNEALLDKARAGLYAKSLEAELSPARLRRFFVEEEGGYRVIKPLRDAVVFARQNLISDPPFSRMDLICCRNLLIYLEPALQRKLLPTFHYALNPGGFLFLGASESVGPFNNLFEPADRKQKIFAKKAAATPARGLPARRPIPPQKKRRIPGLPTELPEGFRSELSAQREADRLMVNEFAPPGVIVNAQLQIIQFRGATADYLTPPRGKATFDVLKMAREELMLPLRAAINRVNKENRPARKDNVRLRHDGRERLVNLQVIPLKNVKERSYLIVFEEAVHPELAAGKASRRRRRGARASPGASVDSSGSAERVDVGALRRRLAQTERELAETRDYLQALQEQHDAANEELQASSEEAQSANEELQSINEELETSKEELESTNEELTTVNEEMANRNAELNRVNADLNNLHVSIQTAIIVVGRDLTIRRFTPLAEKAFNLLSVDLGRPLSGVRHTLLTPADAATAGTRGALGSPLDLEDLVREVIDTVSMSEHEVQNGDGHWYSLRVRPYMTVDNKIDGAVLALLDIDALKRSEREADAARSFAEATIRAVRDPLVVLDGALRVKTANDAFYRTFKVAPRETEGRLIYELGDGQWNIPELRSLLEKILPRNDVFDDFEVTHEFQSIRRRTMLLNGRRLEMVVGTPNLILLGVEDITERRRAEEELHEASDRFRLLAETVPEKIFTARPNGERDYFNQRWLEYSRLSLDQLQDWGWTQLVHPDDLAENQRAWARCIATGEPYYFEQRFRRSDGQYRWHISRAVALKGPEGKVLMWVGSNTDVHDVKESDRRKDEFLAMLAHELRNPLAPISSALEVVRHARDRQAAEKAIDMVERQVGQMVRLVDELLDVSRISRGRIELQRQQIELASAVNQAVEAARPYFESRQQELTVTLPQQPVYIDADATRVAQIVGNLLNNASKFTEKRGRIGLTVETDDNQAVMRVEDSGIGIAPEQLPRIFDMFTQVDTSLERTHSGLGIGLTLVKQLVEMHAGTIEAHSGGLGQGSDFVVRLPMSAEPAPTAPSAPSGVEQAVASVPRRVLVVDDNPDAASSLAMWLEMQGHEVHTAHDGLEAVDVAAKLQPDVILLDVGLPKLNGYEAGRLIRQQRRDRGLMLVALTGWGQEEDKRRSKEAGFDLHLVKPISLSTLEKLLDGVPAQK